MKRFIAIKLLLVSLFMVSLPVQTSAQAVKEIKFEKGKYSKTVAGNVAREATTTYYLELKKNQKLKVRFAGKKQYVFITIKDNKGNTLKEDNKGAVEINTSYTGGYLIEISTKYGQAEKFTLIVEAR